MLWIKTIFVVSVLTLSVSACSMTDIEDVNRIAALEEKFKESGEKLAEIVNELNGLKAAVLAGTIKPEDAAQPIQDALDKIKDLNEDREELQEEIKDIVDNSKKADGSVDWLALLGKLIGGALLGAGVLRASPNKFSDAVTRSRNH